MDLEMCVQGEEEKNTKNWGWLWDYGLRSSRELGFPGVASGKETICQYRRHKRCGFNPWVGKIPWQRAWQTTPVFLPGESYGQRSVTGYSPEGHKMSDMTEMS